MGKVGEFFHVQVMAANISDVYNAVILLGFDPALVDFVGAAEGSFLNKDGKTTSFNTQLKKDKAQVSMNLSRPVNAGGVSGSGTLADITFKAKSKGIVTITLKAAYMLTPTGNKPVDVTLQNGTVEIK